MTAPIRLGETMTTSRSPSPEQRGEALGFRDGRQQAAGFLDNHRVARRAELVKCRIENVDIDPGVCAASGYQGRGGVRKCERLCEVGGIGDPAGCAEALDITASVSAYRLHGRDPGARVAHRRYDRGRNDGLADADVRSNDTYARQRGARNCSVR